MSDENHPALTRPNGEVVTVDAPAPVEIGIDLSTPEKLERAVAQVENAMAYKERVLEIAVKTTRPGAIIDQDGSPYFTEAECERILSLLGGGTIKLMGDPRRIEDEDGHFGYTATVEVSHRVLGTFSGFGSTHSTDKFLGTNKGRSRRQLADVDRHNLAQHACTRAKGSAIRRMLGLDGLTWPDLEAWGLTKEKAGGSVSYRKGGSGGSRQSSGGNGDKTPLTGSGKRLYAISKDRGVSLGAIKAWATEHQGYGGDDILRAPDKILRACAKALEAGEIE